MARNSIRGFAAMSTEKQREIARKGGRASRSSRRSNRGKSKGPVEDLGDLVGF